MADNIHATGVVLADRGIVIAGEAGSGKTQLALALISHARANGLFARLVGDDQLFLKVCHGRLLCVAPATIAGVAEVRGLGPIPLSHAAMAPVDLMVRLVGRAAAERLPVTRTELLLGQQIPVLKLSADDRQAAAMAVLAQLSLSLFG
jgi:serine kinase of HPr protein (carbohydrate metabolism regulator)